MKDVLYAWYSVKMAVVSGVCIYRAADGTEVEVTCVTRKPEHGTNWDDISYVGEVTEFIRKSSTGKLDAVYSLPANQQLQKLLKIVEEASEEDKKDFRWN